VNKRTLATTAASVQAPSIQQKQVDNIEEKNKYSFFTQSSHQVLDNLPQTKQHNFSSKASNSPRFRFNKRFPLSPENSTQWRPFLPKEGGLIQVDIGGHPPIPTGSKQFLAIYYF
jgi:hypothetical protein